MNIFGLPNRKNIQNVVENDKNTKVFELPNFPWLLPSLDGKWRGYRIKKNKGISFVRFEKGGAAD